MRKKKERVTHFGLIMKKGRIWLEDGQWNYLRFDPDKGGDYLKSPRGWPLRSFIREVQRLPPKVTACSTGA